MYSFCSLRGFFSSFSFKFLGDKLLSCAHNQNTESASQYHRYFKRAAHFLYLLCAFGCGKSLESHLHTKDTCLEGESESKTPCHVIGYPRFVMQRSVIRAICLAQSLPTLNTFTRAPKPQPTETYPEAVCR